jgi:hypothetical protein
VDIKQRIRELAHAGGLELTPGEYRCWVDGSIRCPYGLPAGQYILRPEVFCRPQFRQGDGCTVYSQHVVEPELHDRLKAAAVQEHFTARKTDVTGELRSRAEGLEGKAPIEAKALLLAADIIEERGLDCDILLDEDLPTD